MRCDGLEDIVIRLEDNFSEYLSDIRENEDKRMENELVRIENERLRNEYFAKLLEDKKSYYKRFRRVYKTVSEDEKRFALPNEYTELCMLDVFVNGFKLNEEEYQIEEKDSRYFVVLSKALDVLGSVVEMDVIDANTVNVATIDGFLSDESENPVQNKVIKKALDGLRIDLGNVEVLLGEV